MSPHDVGKCLRTTESQLASGLLCVAAAFLHSAEADVVSSGTKKNDGRGPWIFTAVEKTRSHWSRFITKRMQAATGRCER